MTQCASCAADAGDVLLCTSCTTALRIQLTDIAGLVPASTLNGHGHLRGEHQQSLVEDLYVTMARQDQLTRPYDSSRGDSRWSPPMKDHITEVLLALHTTLRSWIPPGKQDHSTGDLAISLLTAVDDLRRHPNVGVFVDQVTTAVHRARHAIDRPHDPRVFLGRCAAPQPDQTPCPRWLYGHPQKDRVRCQACGTEHITEDRRDQLRDQAGDYLGTAAEIAAFLRTTGMRITDSMIRGKAHRHPDRLPARGATPKGHPLYQIRDVVTALSNRYQRPNVAR